MPKDSENIDNVPEKKGKASVESTISLIDFCDLNGVNEVDRNAVYKKYGKTTVKTNNEWKNLLGHKITLKQNN